MLERYAARRRGGPRVYALAIRVRAGARIRAMFAVALYLGAGTAVLGTPPIKPHVLLVLSDDLGYHDLGYKNGGVTQTPHIDALVADGVQMTDYYTYKLCSPTRASIQSGRYPWGVGFYDMDDKNFGDGFHCIAKDTTLMPALMKQAGQFLHARPVISYRLPACWPAKPSLLQWRADVRHLLHCV